MFSEYLQYVERLLAGTGWSIHDPEMAPDILLEAPCGYTIEPDRTCPCPDHHVSPLRGRVL